MELNENIAKLVSQIKEEDSKCNYKPDEVTWEANLNGDANTLGDNLGDKPHASCEAEITSKSWPSQAHHLIPHLTLKEHPLAKWLKAGNGSQLYGDTYYNVDHENNGKWMPYASNLPEWVTGATKLEDRKNNRELMFKIMKLAQIQLHQGRHSTSNRYGFAKQGYKERVKEYLKKIKNNAISHYAGNNACNECTNRKANGDYPPRANTVRYVDAASGYIEIDINNCLIVVSRIAAEFADTIGFDDN